MTRTPLLHDDLAEVLEGWKTWPDATSAQKAAWPQTRKLPRSALGHDGESSLRLLQADGGDGLPVGSVTAATARHYFWDNHEHLWPPDRDLVRFGRFFQLDVLRIVALVCKAQWERYFARQLNWVRDPAGRNLFDLLRGQRERAEELSLDFTLGFDGYMGVSELFACLEEHGGLATRAGWDEARLSLLVQQLILSGMHRVAVRGPEMDAFLAKQDAERSALSLAADADREAFWMKKCQWLESEAEIGRRLFELEGLRLRNAELENRWLGTFGKLYHPLLEQTYLNRSLKRLLAIKETQPELSREGCEALEEEQRQAELRELDELRAEVAAAESFEQAQGAALKPEEAAEYDAECRRLLRRIWLYTHPDRLLHQSFTEAQVARLQVFYREAMQVSGDEIGFPRRALHWLLNILDRVAGLWETMGLDLRSEILIQGETLAEQTAWLEARLRSNERQLKEVHDELFLLSGDPDLAEKRASLSSPGEIERVSREMERRLEALGPENRELEAHLAELFRGGEPPC